MFIFSFIFFLLIALFTTPTPFSHSLVALIVCWSSIVEASSVVLFFRTVVANRNFAGFFLLQILDYFSCCHLISFLFQNVIWHFFPCDLSVQWKWFSFIFVLISRISMARSALVVRTLMCKGARKRPTPFKLKWKSLPYRWFMIKILRNLSFICFRNVAAICLQSSLFKQNDTLKRFIRCVFVCFFLSVPVSPPYFFSLFYLLIFSFFAASPCARREHR